ncbi:sensor histidine kinase [Streptomyces himalayensis]|uniref:histidine kinase n=1 Tax=Streptomyces himalayensis subsp. himalayensis TaxID=2756131 RepID=A0A7W0DK36_9ACTN|nr:nitrate- and nitrite sensing domain-containing protein [Streptomyces himalayensis]MBA2945834.1 sensor histidine kinase [Streptomyces himalayensis subsp. himalayensis]
MRTPRRNQTTGAPPRTAPPARGRRAHAGPPADEHPDMNAGAEASPQAPSPPARAGWRMRPRTVRAKIVCLLMVPVMSLLALWAHATVSTAQDVARLRQLQRVDAEVRAPVADAVAALQVERSAAARYATQPSAGREVELRKLAGRTDRAVAKLRLGKGHTVADGADLPTGVAERLSTFVDGAERLRTLRTAVVERRAGWAETYEQYTETISNAFGVGGALTGIQDAELGSDARVLLEFSQAGEMLAREDALLSSARLTGSLDGERLRLFTGAVDTRRTLTDSAAADLRGPDRAAWRDLADGSAYAAMTAVEDKVLRAPAGRKAAEAAPAAAWDPAHATVQGELLTIQSDAAGWAADRADPFTRGLLTSAGAAVLLGLAAVAASLVISVRIGRGLVVELVSLRNSALEIARRKLPHAMRRLRSGEEIDIRAEAPPGPPAEDEVGQVSEALSTVHRAALRAAVERAELASGISGVFVNLARRSQVLVHRQLNLLDSMERRAEDPNELGDLFRLDHLTTRMRRHAESLIILSGSAPGRAWRMPVSLTNVVRAAVSEIEDYARVEVRHLPDASVIGSAVADLTHLLAELVENAAQFSPPHTKVWINGEPVGNGYALEIEDRGLGMGKETLEQANRRIAQSEALDLFDSDRLGLFVVSRLSARHGIKVHLRTSPYGGTTAVVLLPTALLHTGAAELPTALTADTAVGEERHYARVQEQPGLQHGDHSSVPGDRAPRPALVAPVQAAVEASDIPSEPAPPPGVATLRLHRQPSGEDSDAHGPDGLPRRIRQASLAPQLREHRAEEPAPATSTQDNHERSPEQVRQRMAAYRDGWARGGGRPPGAGSAPRRPGSGPGADSSEGDHA